MRKKLGRSGKRIFSAILSLATIVTSFNMPQATIEAEAETVVTANYFLVDGINEGIVNKHAPGYDGVTWNEEENCAEFNGESWLEIANPLVGVSADTGFYFSFEAYVDPGNVRDYDYIRYNKDKDEWEEANCIGWQRIVDLSDGTTGNYFFVNVGTSGPLNTAVKYNNGTEYKTTYSGGTAKYMGAWHKYTVVVTPDDGWKLYLDGEVIEKAEKHSTITQVLENISTYNTCFVGTSVWESTGTNPDGFFIGKMRNLTFASTYEVRKLGFEANGGEPINGSSLATSVAFNLPDKFPEVKKDGYVFAGWYMDPEFTQKAVERTPIESDQVTLYAKWHQHDWEYIADGDTLKACCHTEDCPAEASAPNYISMKLNGSNQSYSESNIDKASVFSIDDYEDFNKNTGATADVNQIKIYSVDADGNKTGTDVSGSPINVGDYVAELEVSTESGTQTISVPISYSKVDPVVTAPTAKSGLVYDGTARELVNAGSTAHGTISYKLDTDSDFGSSIPKATEPGTYKVIYKVTGDKNHNDVAETTLNVTISKKPVTVGITAQDKVYDGNTKATIEYTLPADALCGSDKLVISGLKANFSDANAGKDKTVTVDASGATITGKNSGFYELTYATTKAEIKKANHTVSPSGITGAATTIQGKPDGKLTKLPDAPTEYRLKGTSEFTEATVGEVTGLAAGIYEIRFKETTNQNASPILEVEVEDGEKVAVELPAAAEQIGYSITVSPATIAWEDTATLTLTVGAGYIADSDFAVKCNDSVLAKTDLGNGKYTFTIPTHSETAVITVEGVKDKTPPTGTITFGAKKATTFTEGQTFGYFQESRADITVTASDEGSGIATVGGIAYHLSDTALSETAIKDGSVVWTNSDSFSIMPGNKKYVYVRLMDESGNVTYLSLDKGIVVFRDSALANDSVTYSRTKNGTDTSVGIALNGNTVKEVRYSGSTLASGTDYVVDSENGTITFKAAFLQTLAAGSDHAVEISYYPLGVDNGLAAAPSKSTLTIKSVKSTGTVAITADLDKAYDGNSANKDNALINKTGTGYTTDSQTGDTNVTIEYKKKTEADTAYTTTAPTAADTYTVRVTVAADDNYTQAIATRDFTISQGTRADAPTGMSSVAATIQGKPDGKITGIAAGTEYRLKGTTDYISVTGSSVTGLVAGTYEVRYKETNNQTASPATEVVVSDGAKIDIELPEIGIREGYTITAEPASIGWEETSTVTITVKQGYSLTKTFDVVLNGSDVSVTDLGEGKLQFTVPVHMTAAKVIVTGISDVTAPTGKLTYGDVESTTFTEGQTFGYFTGSSAKITVTAEDDGSGLPPGGGMYFYLSDTALSRTEIAKVTSWTKGTSVSIDPGYKKFVYAKLSDMKGNNTYLSLDKGIVCFKESSLSSHTLTYERGINGTDAATMPAFNGNTIKAVRCLDGEGRVLTYGTDYLISLGDGSFVFKKDFLNTLAADVLPHKVEISFYPLGENNGDAPGPANYTVNIYVSKAAGTASITANLDKTYDTEPANKNNALINKTGTGYTTYNTTDDSTVTIEYKAKNAADTEYSTEAPINVGEYTVRVTVAEDDDYKQAVATKDFSITQATRATAPAGITPVAETILHKADGKLTTLPVLPAEYRKKGATDYIAIAGTEITGLEAGTYEVRYSETDNYLPSEPCEVVIPGGEKLTVVLPVNQTGYTITASPASIAWDETSTLTLTVSDGYAAGEQLVVKQNGFVLSGTKTGTNTYTYTVPVHSATALITVAGISDSNPPTGKIKMGASEFTTFTAGQTFGYFFDKKVDFTVTAEDKESEMAPGGGISYYLSDTAKSETELKTDASIAWTDGNSFSIMPGEKKFVYVRLMDENGNVAVISPDKGVAIYKESSIETDKIDYVRSKSGNDTSVGITLNDNTVKSVKVTDGDGQLLTDGTDYVVDAVAGTLTFKASMLQTLTAGSGHGIEIELKPLGEDNGEAAGPKKLTLTINVTKSQGTLTGIVDLTKDYDGDPANKDFAIIDKAGKGYSTDNATGDGKVIIEYKEKGAADTDYVTTAPTNVGNYVVRVTVAEDDNYTKASNTREFAIKKAWAVGPTDISLSSNEITYGTSTTGLLNITGDVTGGEMKLALVSKDAEVADSDWSTDMPTKLSVGDYDVYYRVIADDNHTDIEPAKVGSFKVAQKEVGITWSTTDSFIYNGEEQCPEITIDSADLVDDDTCEVVVTGAGIHADSYTATAESLDNENYKFKSDAVLTKNFTITAKEITLAVDDIEIVYGDTIPDIVVKKDGIVEGEDLSMTLTYEVNIDGDLEDDGAHDIVLKADAALTNTDYVLTNGTAGTKLGTLTILAPGPKAWITFDANGGKLGDNTQEIVKFYEGEAYKTSANKLAELKPTRAGYKFIGWFIDSKGNEIMEDGTVIEGDMTLYAGWAYKATKGETEANTDMYVLAIQDVIYTGGAIKPTVTVSDGNTILTPNKDYKISYGNNVNANAGGKYVETNGLSIIDGKVVADNYDPKLPFVVIKGIGNYTSQIRMNFNILPKDISNVDTDTEMNMFLNETIKYAPRAFPGPGLVLKYNSNVTGGSKLMKINKDYAIKYEACEGALPLTSSVKLPRGAKGQYTFTISGKNNFTGDIVRTLTITEDVTSLATARVIIEKASLTSNDEALTTDKLNVKVTLKVGKENVDLVRDEDYTVEYVGPAPVKPGAYSVIIKAKPGSAYVDSKTVKIAVGGADYKQVTVENTPTIVYDGRYHGTSAGAVTLGKGEDAKVLKLNEDYTLTCVSRKDAGYIRTTITGIGAYKGMKRAVSCEIKRYNIVNNTEGLFTVTEQTEPSKYSYRGAKANPVVKFRGETLTLGKDYTIRYKSNKAVGTGTYEIIGLGNFIGILEKKPFEITQFRLDEPGNVTHKCGSINYKAGAAIKPTFSIINTVDGNTALRPNRDYSIVGYSVDGVPCTTMPARGTVITVTVRGRGNYVGDYSFDVPISGVALASAGVGSVARVYTTEAIILRDEDLQLTYKIKSDDEAAIFNEDGGRQIMTVVNREKVYSEISTSIKKGDTIILINGKDYDLSKATYTKNIFVGAGKADIPGMGYFGGSKTVTFRINKKVIQWFS